MKAKDLIEMGIDDPESLVPRMLGQIRCKRDVVKALVARYAVRHRWEDLKNSEVLLIAFPKEVDFEHLLNRSGVATASTMGISSGNINRRVQFMWDRGYLDGLVW